MAVYSFIIRIQVTTFKTASTTVKSEDEKAQIIYPVIVIDAGNLPGWPGICRE
jgi:hypothetical protein